VRKRETRGKKREPGNDGKPTLDFRHLSRGNWNEKGIRRRNTVHLYFVENLSTTPIEGKNRISLGYQGKRNGYLEGQEVE